MVRASEAKLGSVFYHELIRCGVKKILKWRPKWPPKFFFKTAISRERRIVEARKWCQKMRTVKTLLMVCHMVCRKCAVIEKKFKMWKICENFRDFGARVPLFEAYRHIWADYDVWHTYRGHMGHAEKRKKISTKWRKNIFFEVRNFKSENFSLFRLKMEKLANALERSCKDLSNDI